MKVALVLGNGGRGGMQRVVAVLDRALRDHGHEVVVLVGGDDPVHGVAEVVRLPAFVGRLGGWRFAAALRRALNHAVPDVVHGHGLRLAPALAVAARRAPTVLTSHGGPPGSAERAASILRHARITVAACGEGPARTLRAAGVDCTVLPVGVDPVPCSTTRAALAARFGFDEASPIVLSPARLTPQKDPRTVLDAVAATARIQVAFLGDGPLADELAAAIAAAGLERRAVLAGFVDDAANLLGAADAVVLGSRYEGHVLVGLEAMAAAVPFVATACVGIADWVVDGVDALVSPVGEASALGANLEAVTSDPDLAARLAAGGRATATRHSVDEMVAAHLARYRTLLSR